MKKIANRIIGAAAIGLLIISVLATSPVSSFSVSTHVGITTSALRFLKSDVLSDILDEQLYVDSFLAFFPEYHFDSCRFRETTENINALYQRTLQGLDPFDSDLGDAPDAFGQLLHPVQDFYTHSNWVDMGMFGLVDAGLGSWRILEGWDRVVGAGFADPIVIQGETPPSNWALTRAGNLIQVTIPDDGTLRGLITGYYGLSDDCPDNVAISHGDLNKDDPGRPLFVEAHTLAVRQTEHEWCRLLNLVELEHGEDGIDFLMANWVADRSRAESLCEGKNVPYDPASGSGRWSTAYAGSDNDEAYDLVQTSDGGYALAGSKSRFLGSGRWLAEDFWLIKTDGSGTVLWNRTYNRSASVDQGRSLIQTSDGGYAIVGITDSDFWLIKTDSSGGLEWSRTYGGTQIDWPYSLIQTTDGGFALLGITYSSGAGSVDAWLVKISSQGSPQWSKTFGGTSADYAYSLVQTSDGGYVFVGITQSFGAGSYDIWLVKTDGSGNPQWSRTYGGPWYEDARSVIQTRDGGYAIAGAREIILTPYDSDYNAWLLKTDPSGNIQWDAEYGGLEDDGLGLLVQTSDDGYVLAGTTASFGVRCVADYPPCSAFDTFNAWLVKTSSSGGLEWSRTYGGTKLDAPRSLIQARDGGFVFSGISDSFSSFGSDLWWVKTDDRGTLNNPVLLVHGFSSGASDAWESTAKGPFDFANTLRGRGFEVWVLDYSGPDPILYTPGVQVALARPRGYQAGAGGNIIAYSKALAEAVDLVRLRTRAKQVDIVAHSMGGLVSRWYLQQAEGRDRNDVGKLIMLGTPNHGTPLAKFPEFLVENYGLPVSSPAIEQMIPCSAFLNKLNFGDPKTCQGVDTISRDVHYHTVIGTNPQLDLSLQRVREEVVSLSLLPGPDDGVVAADSVRLSGVASTEFELGHFDLHEQLAVLDEVVRILEDDPSEVLSQPSLVEESLIQEAPEIRASISIGETRLHEITVSFSNSSGFILVWDQGTLTFRLVTPSGLRIDPSTLPPNVTFLNANGIAAYNVEAPEEGIWKAEISSVQNANYLLTTVMGSALDFSMIFDKKHFAPSEQAAIRARLRNGPSPLTGSMLSAEIARPDGLRESLQLFDDGLHTDFAADDGVYGSIFTSTSMSGAYLIFVNASGVSGGTPFVRSARSTIFVDALPDLSIQGILLSNAIALENSIVRVTITVSNSGDCTESNGELNVFDSISTAELKQIHASGFSLDANASVTLSFEFVIAGVGTHTMIASVYTSSDPDTDLSDNSLTTTVLVIALADLTRVFELDWADYDNDRRVNIVDMANAARVYNRPDLYWDLTLNGVTDIVDIAIAAGYYGRSFSEEQYLGKGHPAGTMDLFWQNVCDQLPDPHGTYCRTRI